MPNQVPVTSELYKLVRDSTHGQAVFGHVHLHTKPVGHCEVVCGGSRPIRCTIAPAPTEGNARGLNKNGRHHVALKKR